MDARETDQTTDRSAGWLLLSAVVVGLALRGIDASVKSLWLDEFHSLYCAYAPNLRELVERVEPDFHPPLYFVWLHFLRDLPAQSLRWLGILAGMASLLPLTALGRRMGLSPLARGLAALAFAAMPYQIWFGTELRSYPFLLLATTTMTWAAFTDRAAPRTRFVAFALAAGLGLYHHYFAAAAILVVGAARLAFRAPRLLPWWQLVLAGSLGVASFLPWVAVDESWLLEDPASLIRTDKATEDLALPAGETVAPSDLLDVDRTKLLEALPRLVVPRLASLGEPLASVARPAAALLFATLLAGALRYLLALARREDVPRSRVFFGVHATWLLALGLTLWACLYFWNRLTEQYFVIGAWGLALSAGVFVDGFARRRSKRLYALALGASLLVVGTAHALGASREDTRGGVRLAVREGGPDALYTAALWQPPWYSERIVFDVYAPEVDALEPWDVPRVDEPGGRRPLYVVTRGRMWGPRPRRYKLWVTIVPGREMVRELRVDAETWVHEFLPAEAPAPPPPGDR